MNTAKGAMLLTYLYYISFYLISLFDLLIKTP